jgi:nucleoside-diphosphate-sugar epimerase
VKQLVTGASGFIGSHLVHKLADDGHEVRALVRRNSSREHLSEDGRRDFEFVVGELHDVAAMTEAMTGAEIVYHVAGATAAFDRATFDRTNVDGTRTVLAAARAAGVRRVVMVSSLMAAGPSHPDVARREHHRHNEGFSDYGDSKLAAERLAFAAAREGTLEVVIVRPPLVYGPRDRDVLQMIRSAKLGVVAIAGFHQQWMSMIHVRDLVAGIALAGTKGTPLPREGPHVLAGGG